MKKSGERGSALLGLLIVMSLGLFVLLSIKSVISQYLLQERSLHWVFFKNSENIKRVREVVTGLANADIHWRIVGSEVSCRLFGGEGDYIDQISGWYGRRLSKACLDGQERELVGFYYADDLDDRPRVQYTYAVKTLPMPALPRIINGKVSSTESYLQIEVNDEGKYYQYLFYDSINVADVVLLQSVAPEGFFLLFNGALWLLPRDNATPKLLFESGYLSRGVVIADLMDDAGFYLLRRQALGGSLGAVVTMDFYPRLEGVLLFAGAQRLFQEVLAFDTYRVVLLDPFKIVVELGSFNEKQLLSIMWDGNKGWGDRYLWRSRGDIDCPLQSEKYEPVAGWVLGCQRKIDVIKIGFQ